MAGLFLYDICRVMFPKFCFKRITEGYASDAHEEPIAGLGIPTHRFNKSFKERHLFHRLDNACLSSSLNEASNFTQL